jgi:hypothetical protein
MKKTTDEIFSLFINSVSNINDIQSIGKTGTKELPESNESDVDIIIFCDEIPNYETRKTIYNSIENNLDSIRINDYKSKHWGTTGFIFINGLEICLMYFTVIEMKKEIEQILNGERNEKKQSHI